MRLLGLTSRATVAGDYWPGEAENLLNAIMEESRVAGKRGGGAAAVLSTKGGKTKILPVVQFPNILQNFAKQSRRIFKGDIHCQVFCCAK